MEVVMKRLTQKRLKELLHYNPETGIFTRLKTVPGKAKKDNIAGYIKKDGYRAISIDHKRYYASRLAWLYMEGYFPENEIDHKNRIRHDDRWINLRHVSHQCNLRNCGISKNNKSGITGVFWYGPSQKWGARIMISGKDIFLGYFKGKTDAVRARWNAEVKHGFSGCNTTSMAYLYLRKSKQ